MATKVSNPVVGAVQCPKCLNIIISLYHYDCHHCSCGQTMIDGGRDYMRVGYAPGQQPHHIQIELVSGLTFSDLANPKNKHLGLIKTRNMVYNILYRYTLNAAGKFYRYQKKA